MSERLQNYLFKKKVVKKISKIFRMTELDSREDSENLEFPPLEGFKEAFTGPHYSDAETERIRNEYDQG